MVFLIVRIRAQHDVMPKHQIKKMEEKVKFQKKQKKYMHYAASMKW